MKKRICFSEEKSGAATVVVVDVHDEFHDFLCLILSREKKLWTRFFELVAAATVSSWAV